MATQQPPRPWFRLATMMRPAAPAPAQPPPTRPAAPTTVLQPTPPLPPFRPPVALPQPSTQPPEPPPPLIPAVASPPPPPQATAPPSPVQAPAQFNLPIASPSSASRSPVAASPAPRSPVAPFAIPTQAALPAATSEPAPQAEPNNTESPIISASSVSATPQVVSSPTFPPSPKTNAFAAPSSPRLPTSPTPKTLLSSPPAPLPPPPSPARVPAPSTATVTAPPPPSPVRPASIIPSPKVVKQWDRKTPPDRSPVLKTLSSPPSPLTLPPPAQLKPDDSDYLEPIPAEAEQKTVLMQDTSNEKPKINKHGEVKKDTKGILSKKTGTNSSEEQFGMRIITLAGENKGAVMDLSSPSRRKLTGTYNDNNNRGKKINGSRVMDEDARLKMKEEENGKNGMMKKQPMDAFVNSNVQGVNNSILYNCAYTNRDPGVHLSVSRNGNAGRGAHLLKDTALHH